MAEIRLAPQAKKQFERLPKSSKIKIEKAINRLASNPVLGKKLKGELEGRYSLRAWPYRIIYIFDQTNKILFVTSILHRQGVYK